MSGAWVLGLMIIPISYFAIIIFLITRIFTKMVKSKKNESNNIKVSSVIKKGVGIILILILVALFMFPLRIFFIPEDDSVENKIMNEERVRLEKEELKQKEKENKENELEEKFNNLLDSNFISIGDIGLNDDYSKIVEFELLILNNNMPSDELELANEMVKSYNNIKEELEKYNCSTEMICFEFTNGNSFAEETSTFYKEGGYIKELKDSYLIYLNPAPIKIKK